MNEEPSLLSLPVEVLRLIGDYLSPHELVAMSGVCRYLRSVFNDNSLWQKYSDGGRISRGLDTTVSLVEPKFEISQTTSLEPLCEHRIYFSKQSRLLNNLRQGRFVEQSIEFSASVFPSGGPEPVLKNKKKTYGSKFLFTKDQADNSESIMVFDIENSPTLLLSVNIEPRLDVCEIMWLQVAGDRLVVRRENWFTVYEIKLPIESIDVLYSINVNLHRDDIGEQFIIGKYLFVDDNEYNVVHVWDLTDGNQCNDIHPKISCDAFNMINYSQNEELVLFLGGCTIDDSSDPYACVYDINLNDFSPFNPTISANDFKGVDIDGDLDSNHVVFLVLDSNLESLTCSALVFDYNNSTLVAKRSDLHAHGAPSARIVSGYLVMPSKVGVSVMDLKSLQIVWEVQLDMSESPEGLLTAHWVDVLYIASLTCIIVIHKEIGVEMWDFNTRRKLLDMPEGYSTLNDTCSKLISYKSNRITMNEEPSLLSLPVEVLRLIGDYLSPHELVAMSGVCRYLRSVFNDNSLWQKYSDGGRISQGLDTTVSLVEPKFEISQTTSLEPLCEHRIHFSKQSRLLNNLRQGRFVEQSIEFSASIFPSKELKNKKKTYGNKFLFTKDQADNRESIMIFDIENSPSLLLSVNIEPRLDVCEIMWLQVAGDRLVVRRENWFTVYEIKLPIESIDVLYSINVNLHRDDIGEQFIIGKYLFVDDNEYNVVHVWDLTDGNQCNDIHPKISCDAFTMINYSQNEELVLFLGGCTIEDSSDPYACVYDINLKDFSSFNPTISAKDFKRVDIDGDLDSNHVVFLVRGSNLESRTCSVLVFDYNNSTLVAKRSDLHAHGPNDISPRIVSGYLVVPSKVGVSVMDLKSLQIVWEVQLDMPEQGMLEVEWVDVLYIASLTCVIVVHKETGVEMWDFNTRRKVLDMPEGFSTLNDTCSKLISYASNRITVRSFW